MPAADYLSTFFDGIMDAAKNRELYRLALFRIITRPTGFAVRCVGMSPVAITPLCTRHCYQCYLPHSMASKDGCHRPKLSGWQVLTAVQTDVITLVCISDGHIIRRCEWRQNIIHSLIYSHHGTAINSHWQRWSVTELEIAKLFHIRSIWNKNT